MLEESLLDIFFTDIQNNFINPTANQSDHLANLKPLDHEYPMLDWRYRLIGFIEALLISGQYHIEHYEKLKFELFGNSAVFQEPRFGREHQFNLMVTSNKGRIFDFDVAAQNAHDAYHQLSKRMAYRAIADISQVDVYSGKLSQRYDDALLYSFKETELIYIHLWK